MSIYGLRGSYLIFYRKKLQIFEVVSLLFIQDLFPTLIQRGGDSRGTTFASEPLHPYSYGYGYGRGYYY